MNSQVVENNVTDGNDRTNQLAEDDRRSAMPSLAPVAFAPSKAVSSRPLKNHRLRFLNYGLASFCGALLALLAFGDKLDPPAGPAAAVNLRTAAAPLVQAAPTVSLPAVQTSRVVHQDRVKPTTITLAPVKIVVRLRDLRGD
jgi:hypothetical protein